MFDSRMEDELRKIEESDLYQDNTKRLQEEIDYLKMVIGKQNLTITKLLEKRDGKE